MISEAELRRHAVTAGVDLMVQDLDYGLGWFLAGLFTKTAAAQYLVFKGGTCLRKCYFADYRFSEDLDFTLRAAWPISAVAEAIEAVRQALPVKLAAKGLPPETASVASLTQRQSVFAGDWERRLAHLLPPLQPVTFAEAWQSVMQLVKALQTAETAAADAGG